MISTQFCCTVWLCNNCIEDRLPECLLVPKPLSLRNKVQSSVSQCLSVCLFVCLSAPPPPPSLSLLTKITVIVVSKYLFSAVYTEFTPTASCMHHSDVRESTIMLYKLYISAV